MADRKIEMHWACGSCRTRNLGRHKVCTNCGDPKDPSEPWLMPDDPGAAPSVVDPQLLQQARAGPDWQCAFCGSHQKRSDGRCQQCGAEQAQGVSASKVAAAPIAVRPQRSRGWLRWLSISCLGVVVLGCASMVLAAVFIKPDPPRPVKPIAVSAQVVSARWDRDVDIERYQVVSEEGFVEQRPPGAFDVRSLGPRHHHDEQILDHYETEHYSEQVPYQDTETYSEQEPCGQDCTTTAPSCHEECAPDNNGFASCHDVCSGGGTSCSPRYCPVTHTRPITRYRDEDRTRQIPRYRSEPRFAEAFGWHVWRWLHDRTVSTNGDAAQELHWPSDTELAPPAPLGEGEQERSQRQERFQTTLLMADGTQRIEPESNLAEFQRVTGQPCWYLDGAGRPLKPAPR